MWEGYFVSPQSDIRAFLAAAVLAVPRERKFPGSKLYADLMGAAGMKTHKHEGMTILSMQNTTNTGTSAMVRKVRNAVLAALSRGEI